MFAALRDVAPALKKAVHEDPKVLIDQFKKEILQMLESVKT